MKRASKEAIKYSCLKFHYAETIPAASVSYSVFNNSGDWCGCVLFGGGASANMGKPYKLLHGQYLELQRVALNGKQETTSAVIAAAVRLVKRDCPTVRLLMSYADHGQDHFGTVYQASNWYFVQNIKSSGTDLYWEGKWRHDRFGGKLRHKISKEAFAKIKKRKRPGKYKYLFPLTREMRELCEGLALDYPKKSE